MNNLSNSVKKFVSNKNTVTILGLVLAVIVLYTAYNFRINQKVQLKRVPYAKQTIQPKTEITSDMMNDLFEKYGDTIDYDQDRHMKVIISKSTRRKRYFGRK